MNKKVIKNISMGLFSQVIILLLGFIVPRIILTHYGSDTNGLMNTITQIFTYMALLEAGISQASKNALYKHIINDDKNEISIIMSSSRRYYRKISYIYLASVICLSVIVPFILQTNIDYWTIFFFVLFEGLTSVVAFYFINTWTCLLQADGKSYITNAITLLNKILCYGIRIILALLEINIAFIQVGYFIVSLIQLLIYYLYMRRDYRWVDYTAAPKDYKLLNRNSYIISEVAWTIFSSTDLIILSVFVSTSLASVYSTYNMVFVALNGVLTSVYQSLNYNLGQVFHSNTEHYKKLHDLFNSVFIGATTVCMCTAYCLIIPFIKLYTNGVNDINYIYTSLPILFCLVQLLTWSRMTDGTLINIAGYVKRANKIYIIEATLNVILSLILVQYFDILGVLLGTVLALPIRLVYSIYETNIKILHRKIWKPITIILINFAIFCIAVIFNHYIQFDITSYLQFFMYGILYFIVFSIIVFLLNLVVNKDILKIRYLIKRDR